MTADLVLEPFAGPGGWSVALADLGFTNTLGLEMDADSCATARAAGHPRLQVDVSMVDLREYAGLVHGLVMSPPCTPFSAAGKGLGKLDRPRIEAHIARIKQAGKWLHYSRTGWHDRISPLVLEVLRYALVLRPQWIACEQVPQVLPFWLLVADVLRGHGYHADTAVLSAEEYGVPQTRKRAILIANRTAEVSLPAPTHRAYRKGIDRDAGDQSLRPWVSMADALGSSAREMVQWRGAGMTARHGERPPRTLGEPSFTMAGLGGSGSGPLRWAPIAMQGNQRPGGSSEYQQRSTDAPAQTITGNVRSASWVTSEACVQRAWQMTGADRVSVQEAAILQSFSADYPWQGTKTSQYRQVGNAVPPGLAKPVLAASAGIELAAERAA